MNKNGIDREKIQRYLSGECSPTDSGALRDLIDSNEENRKAFIEERWLFDSVNLTLDEKALTNGRQRGRLFYHLSAVAAIAVFVFVSVAHLSIYQKNRPANIQTISTLPGQSSIVTLPDGSTVMLNSLSSISYPQNFGRKTREISLSGEAYFQIQKEPSRPFIVKTCYGEVEVKGTVFNVEAYEKSGDFVTSLFSGAVDVRIDSQTVSLNPSEMAFVKDGVLATKQIEDYSHFRWRDGYICFNDESFSDILNMLEKNFGYDFNLGVSAACSKCFSGKFKKNDEVSNILDALQAVVDFEYDIDYVNRSITIL